MASLTRLRNAQDRNGACATGILWYTVRSMHDRIAIDPGIQHGKPVIRGTRVPVVRVVGGLAGGMTVAEVCREYAVTEEDVRAALEYAAELIDSEHDHRPPAKRNQKPGF